MTVDCSCIQQLVKKSNHRPRPRIPCIVISLTEMIQYIHSKFCLLEKVIISGSHVSSPIALTRCMGTARNPFSVFWDNRQQACSLLEIRTLTFLSSSKSERKIFLHLSFVLAECTNVRNIYLFLSCSRFLAEG
jgi:hypothetical protein